MADPESAGLPRLVRGSVVTHRRRCGKPNCRCADGEALHESTVLSYSEGGRTRLLMRPADQVAAAVGAAAVAGGVFADPFAASHDIFETLVGWLGHAEASALSAAELEERLEVQSREVFRQLFADYLELRARDEPRLSRVVDAQAMTHGTVEVGHTRPLATVFGEVGVRRIAFRKRGCPNLYPADAGLNLPTEKQSHGLRKLAAVEGSRGSFDEAVQAIERATGQKVGKRQVEGLAALAAVDFESFYATRLPPPGTAHDLLVLQVDGKGIVMRPDALRPATAKAAAKARHKLTTRLSKGKKLSLIHISEPT